MAARKKRPAAAVEAISRRIQKGAGTAAVGTFLKAGLHEDASVPRPRRRYGAGLGTRGKGRR